MTAAHLAWVRRLPCSVPDCHVMPVHTHHVRTAANSGTGLKPDDKHAVPLCWEHHCELHQAGRLTFEAKYGLDLMAEAERLAQASGTEVPF